jgi:hypothetical protein
LRPLLAALLAVSAVGCRTADPQNPSGHPGPEDRAPVGKSVDENPNAALPLPQGIEVSFEDELLEVSRYRKLDMPKRLLGLRVEVPELIAHVERAVDLETPEHALLGTEAMLVALGVVPQDFSYRSTMLRLLKGQLAGLYEPRLKVMLIRADLEGVERRMTLLHELVHALQDEHFDLDDVVEWTSDDTDRSSALSCLAEGDATSAMFDGVLPSGQTAISLPPGFIVERMRSQATLSDDKDIPKLIQESLRSPYLDGVAFVDQLRRRGGWEEVNRVWMKPPVSTEQILHLDKYDSGEPPISVAIPDPPPDPRKWTALLSDVWGEQSLRLVFEEWQDRAGAEVSAAGWGGDRIVVYQSGDRTATAWKVVADTEKDAEEMRQAFLRSIQGAESDEVKGASPDSPETPRCGPISRASPAPVLAIARFGSTVIVTGAPLDRKNLVWGSCTEAETWLNALRPLAASK